MTKLKNAFTMTAIAAMVAGGLLTPGAKAQDGSGMKPSTPKLETTTVEGTLIDTKCYAMNHANTGNDHHDPVMGLVKDCAAKCAKDGIPVGVLEENGKVIVLSAPSKAFAPYMGQHVRATGTAAFDGTALVPDKVEAQAADDAWKEVKLSTMM